MAEWKDTCNLPRTTFSMKANLQTTEPETIARWDAMDLYGRIRQARTGATTYLLHDGPPYANGEIHIGTALNKILKDFVVKSHNMLGFDAPYLPGWDCHGLPIELKVDRELGPKKRQMSVADFRRECRKYAEKYVDVQRRGFKSLGVLGQWDDPYLTMAFTYQASIVRALGAFVDQGMVYKGKKPVHWCTHCRTALAEAEVEYEPHVSPSIYVEFPLSEASRAELISRVEGAYPAASLESDAADLMRTQPLSVLIWTTTPWTIPSNLAVAFHPHVSYGLFRNAGRLFFAAVNLKASLETVLGPIDGPLAYWPGHVFEGLNFRHPLYDRDSLGVVAEYVELDAGTGAVHTAPGHGADDYLTGIKYGLDIYAPLDAGGHYNDTVELFAGQQVWKANPHVEAALKERGRLWHREDFHHQYPHCWRCHHPVIFLATAQWFISMDTHDLRKKALQAIADTRWIPSWGRARIEGMIANRPDWCISRQRAWGVPIPAMDCTKCGTAVLTKALVDQAASVFDAYGADAWYERPLAEFLPAGLTCSSCGGTEFEREANILDVWFDSGSSHEAVLPFRKDQRWPADIYLEGSDQHRGWFHSSLLVGIGTRGRAPFDQVLTHGFTMAEDGRKMSKSLGNSISVQDVMKQSGAEIIRLWAAMADYREDTRIGKEILTRTVEAYRKIRNVLRVLVANLYDFDPANDAVPLEGMEEIDRWMLAKYADAATRMVKAYDDYDYPAIFQIANQLITVDISAFYVDVTKDRMYTFGAKSRARRSGQTAMFVVVDGLARLLAPILSITMDELWRGLPGEREASVHMALFRRDLEPLVNSSLLGKWPKLRSVREGVNEALEFKRQAKVIGGNLTAKVTVRGYGWRWDLLKEYEAFLPTLFGVSVVVLEPLIPGTPADPEADVNLEDTEGEALDLGSVRVERDTYRGLLSIYVTRAVGTKCERCWRMVPEVSQAPGQVGLCPRCVDALGEAVSF